MAEQERGCGISFKLPDQTMIWVKRDDWAEVIEDVRVIKGDAYVTQLEAALKGGPAAPQQAAPPSPPRPATPPGEQVLTPEAVAAQLGGGEVSEQAFQVCPACGALKDRWIKPGTSKRTGKPYKGFYGCPTQGCPGK